MIGHKLSPVLCEIESALWEFEEQELGNPKFTKEGFRAILKIFMCGIMDKMWEMQLAEEIDMNIRGEMARKCGEEIRKIVKVYTGIETINLYK